VKLSAEKKQLEARVRDLELENSLLREEANFWKAAWRRGRTKATAKSLTEVNQDLAEIDSHLDNVYESLQSELATTGKK